MVILIRYLPIFFVLLSLLIFSSNISAQPWDYPTAKLSTTWANTVTANHSVSFTDGSLVRAILLRGTFGPRYACGFFCNGTNCDDNYIFAIYIVQTNSVSFISQPAIGFPQVVWSANRNNPVKLNSTLELTSTGDLVLKDVDGTVVWNTKTGGKGVVGLSLTEMGNLVLFDSKNKTVWDSFDYPTDTLVPGQKLVSGQKLTASVSNTNGSEGGLFTLTVTSGSLFAYANSNPTQIYYDRQISGKKTGTRPSYLRYTNGSLAMYILNSEPNDPDDFIPVPTASSAQYMKFGSDGHMRVYEWGVGWRQVADIFTGFLGECAYPMACGRNGICLNGQCSCPKSRTDKLSYFRPVNSLQPNMGCKAITPLKCGASKHKLIQLENTGYFTYSNGMQNTNVESCKSACLKNCSCKAALFRYGTNSSRGDCYMPTELFTMMINDQQKTHYNASAYVKVQIA